MAIPTGGFPTDPIRRIGADSSNAACLIYKTLRAPFGAAGGFLVWRTCPHFCGRGG